MCQALVCEKIKESVIHMYATWAVWGDDSGQTCKTQW